MVIALILFIVGLCMGSFITALVWRIHEQSKKTKKTPPKNQKLSILKGRSLCPNCNHQLAWYDLIPVVSWLTLWGRCRYCKRSISWQYPAVELLTALTFSLSYVFWPAGPGSTGDWWLLGTWLICSVGLIALAIYDLRWMLLPNRIIYPTFFVAMVGQLSYILFISHNVLHNLFLLILSVTIASGIFWLLFQVSKGRWIGYGDVRLGLITGTLLAHPEKSFAMIFLASLLGCVAVIPDLLRSNKSFGSKLPFGPFLILATGIIFIFGDSIINWYKSFFDFTL